MAGEDDGYSGEARLTSGFTVGYLPQEPVLDPAKDVAGNVADGIAERKALVDRFYEVCTAMGDPDADFDEITRGQDRLVLGGRELHGRAYAASFGFKGSDQQKLVGELSGGERNRVQLAKVLKSGGNVLLLDEPTNDLDVDTLRPLEDALLGFPGCVVVISHDRLFLDRIATHVLAFEGDSRVRWFEGNFTGYELDRKRRLGMEAEQAQRRSAARSGDDYAGHRS